MNMERSLRKLLNEFCPDRRFANVNEAVAPYRLRNSVAEGLMALVVVASSPDSPDHDLIVKFPSSKPTDGLDELDARIRSLKHEASVLYDCRDIPNVVDLIDDRTHEELPFMVIRHLGANLKQDIERRQRLSFAECAEMLRDVGGALEQMHKRDMHHYDVKPENIVCGPNGWTLIDPSLPDIRTEQFQHEAIEQEQGEERDIYALGVSCRLAMLGYGGTMLNSSFFNSLENENDEFARLFRRMLMDGRCKAPDARTVRKVAERLLDAIAD